jgi:hypothetical protein
VTLIEHTAYPRLKRTLTPKELDQIYTPTLAEIFLAHRTAKGPVAMLGFLVHLKVFQRLGYAVATSEVPTSIVDYIATCANIQLSSRDLTGYDDSGTRRRHLPLIWEAISIQPYGPPARKAFLRAMVEAARTKDDLADLINVALEELVHCRFAACLWDTGSGSPSRSRRRRPWHLSPGRAPPLRGDKSLAGRLVCHRAHHLLVRVAGPQTRCGQSDPHEYGF